jgi:hypothetical protein
MILTPIVHNKLVIVERKVSMMFNISVTFTLLNPLLPPTCFASLNMQVDQAARVILMQINEDGACYSVSSIIKWLISSEKYIT